LLPASGLGETAHTRTDARAPPWPFRDTIRMSHDIHALIDHRTSCAADPAQPRR